MNGQPTAQLSGNVSADYQSTHLRAGTTPGPPAIPTILASIKTSTDAAPSAPSAASTPSVPLPLGFKSWLGHLPPLFWVTLQSAFFSGKDFQHGEFGLWIIAWQSVAGTFHPSQRATHTWTIILTLLSLPFGTLWNNVPSLWVSYRWGAWSVLFNQFQSLGMVVVMAVLGVFSLAHDAVFASAMADVDWAAFFVIVMTANIVYFKIPVFATGVHLLSTRTDAEDFDQTIMEAAVIDV